MHLRLAMLFVLLALVAASADSRAADYRCIVERKIDSERVYTKEHLEQWKFSVLVEDQGATAFVPRCSFTSLEQKVTCDRYEVDRGAFDDHVKIKKYYVFRGQFDMQIFANLSFVENNGRGTIAFGKCIITSP